MRNEFKKVLTHLAVASVLNVTITACGASDENSSETKVTNGREIGENSFPSVVMLILDLPEGQGVCTGTFVSDSQLITAAHCMEGLSEEKPRLYAVTKKMSEGKESYVSIARAISFKRNPNYDIKLGVSPFDLSVVTFPANSAPSNSQLASISPKIGDALTIVGYGNNVDTRTPEGGLSGSGSTVKRVGNNKIGDVQGGFISFVGLASADGLTKTGNLVASGEGDSGGPLYVNGKVAGVTSGGGLRDNGRGGVVAISRYVDINSSVSRAFLASVLQPARVR